jgi:hypothetical protein
LTAAFNNKAFGRFPGEAAFDSLNQSYAAPALATNGSYTSTQTGIQFDFPGYRPGDASDNVICDSQIVSVPAAQYFSASFLVASDVELTTVSGNVTYIYTDNSTSTTELRSEPWFAFLTINRGEIVYPYRFTANGTNGNTSHIFEVTSPLSTGKILSTIELPSTTNTTTGRLHVFAMTLWQGSQVSIQSVRPTQQQLANGSQLVEVTLNNAGSSCVSGSGLKLKLRGPGITTTQPGHLKRLCPGDQKTVKIGVHGSYNGWATVVLDDGELKQKQHFEVDLGLTNWTSDLSNLARHESPDWFDSAKFGIFIHWGPYSVTGWATQHPTSLTRNGSGGTVPIIRKLIEAISTTIAFVRSVPIGTTTTVSMTTRPRNSMQKNGLTYSPMLAPLISYSRRSTTMALPTLIPRGLRTAPHYIMARSATYSRSCLMLRKSINQVCAAGPTSLCQNGSIRTLHPTASRSLPRTAQPLGLASSLVTRILAWKSLTPVASLSTTSLPISWSHRWRFWPTTTRPISCGATAAPPMEQLLSLRTGGTRPASRAARLPSTLVAEWLRWQTLTLQNMLPFRLHSRGSGSLIKAWILTAMATTGESSFAGTTSQMNTS